MVLYRGEPKAGSSGRAVSAALSGSPGKTNTKP
ncbi:hypothetical protein SPURM210S_06601 [Streptomyces purpurascens]